MTDQNMTPEQRRAAVRGLALPGATAQAASPNAQPAKKAGSQAKNLAVAGAAGAAGFFLLGPVGAVLGAAGGYGFMWIKQRGLPGVK